MYNINEVIKDFGYLCLKKRLKDRVFIHDGLILV